MGLPDNAAAGLPAPRDDEPATLREDLVDELADHLNCAMQRELRKNDVPEEAAKQVRKRFGDPRAVLRKLWFDAMKEKIMSQRLTIAAILLLAFSSIAATAFAWTALRDSRNTAAAIQESNAALMQKVTELLAARPEAPAAAANSDWTHVKFQLVLDEPKGAPAAGFSLQLFGKEVNGQDISVGPKQSDASGQIDFGLIPAGGYTIQEFKAPWGEKTIGRQLIIPPGQNFSRTITCPSAPIPRTDVSIEIENASALGERKALIVCDFFGSYRRKLDDWNWEPPVSWRENFSIAFDSSGKPVHSGHCYSSHFSPPSNLSFRVPEGVILVGQGKLDLANALLRNLRERNGLSNVLPLGTVEHWISAIKIIPAASIPTRKDNAGWEESLAVPAVGFRYDNSAYDPITGKLPKDTRLFMQPVPGKENTWKIRIPEPLIEQARELIALTDQANESKADAPANRLQKPNGPEGDNQARGDGRQSIERLGITKLSRMISSEGKSNVTDDLLQKTKFRGGLKLEAIKSDSVAGKAGLKQGDILVGLDKYETVTPENLAWVVNRHREKDQPLKFHILRNRQTLFGHIQLPDGGPEKAHDPVGTEKPNADGKTNSQ